MRRSHVLVSILVVAAALAGCRGTPIAVSAELFDEVRARNDEMESRLRAGDMRGVAAIYADDGILLSASSRRHEGRAAIDAYWERFTSGVEWELSIDSLEGEPDLLHQRGTSRLTQLRDGVESVGVVEFVLVWVRDESGELRIAVDAYWEPSGE